MTQPKFRLSDSKAMLASALQNVRTKGRWPEGKAIFDRRSISRLLMTLVALFAMTTGAWAETVTWSDTDMKTSGNADFTKDGVTVTPDNSNGNAKSGNYFYSYGMNTFTTTLGNFTKIEIEFKPSSSSLKISGWDYELIEAVQPDPIDHPDSWYYTGKLTWEGNAESVSIQGNVSNIQSITFTIDPNAVPITWDATAKTATLTNGMPAGNVTVSVDYFPQAEFAMSTDPTPVALAPAAIANVPANTDAPIVTAGTVANIGTSQVKQGTLKYFVKQADGNTAPTAPDYDDDGWDENVPTANELKQGDVYVWYYIEGAEPANIADRTDANTRSDSDIMPLGSNGVVTLLPEPTYDVSLNKTDLAEGEPALWKAKSTNVTTAVNLGEADLEGVKKSETVTVTYSGTKKIIGVKAEKKAATKKLTLKGTYLSNGRLVTKSFEIEYTDNDTWKDIAERYDEVSLLDNSNGPEGKIVMFWRDNSQHINGFELKSNESTYENKLVSINDKVSAYSSYYLY